MDFALTPYGPAALRIAVAELADAGAVAAALRSAHLAGVNDVASGERVVVVHLSADTTQTEQVERAVIEVLDHMEASEPTVSSGPLVEIPIVYDGIDLKTVARYCSLDVPGFIARHQAAEYRVAFCGFAPGFGYLTGGDPALVVARRNRPRTRVPAGAVGLADSYCGIYPSDGPGGWQLIGTTTRRLFDPSLPQPALLAPGTVVRFTS